ncbi:winged helix-turn-helix domain-containing protein [Streptomyces sp. 11-1-2]|uniref:winged helix-turn-helix domain-containing protein n=1 Tax=unclassified Streptomyces TaxID=2593676 RepID=UPI0031FEF3C4
MRFPQGGGLTAQRRAARERLRLRATERFAVKGDSTSIAKDLRVSVRSVQRWRRRSWKAHGPPGLRSKSPDCLPALSEEPFAVLEREPAKGPVAHGWPDRGPGPDQDADQAAVPQERHHPGAAALLKRQGFGCQVPARRASERDEEAVAGWASNTVAGHPTPSTTPRARAGAAPAAGGRPVVDPAVRCRVPGCRAQDRVGGVRARPRAGVEFKA